MLVTLTKLFFSLGFLLVINQAQASTLTSEIVLKQTNSRIQTLLRDSQALNFFLEEDLIDASRFLDEAKIIWINSMNEYPLIYSLDSKKQIHLSQFYSFKGTSEARIATVLTILFQIKRQLDGSSLSLPQVRIDIFSKKFAPLLFREVENCTLSLYPVAFPLKPHQREKLMKKVFSLVSSRQFSYDSNVAENVLVIRGKEKTDTGCRGNNRYVVTLGAEMILIQNVESVLIGETQGFSCDTSEEATDNALSKLTKMLNQTSKCNTAF